MGNVRRVYVEKKPEYAVQAKDLFHEIKSYLGIKTLTSVRVLIRYDVENISEETFEKACRGVFAEPPVDILYKETFPAAEDDRIFSVEFLPGQFDQRADSAEQCIQFIKEDEKPVIRTATTYVIGGELTDEQFEAVKHHCINPTILKSFQIHMSSIDNIIHALAFIVFRIPGKRIKMAHGDNRLIGAEYSLQRLQTHFLPPWQLEPPLHPPYQGNRS